ncbi:MAG: dihydropteroate synthase [Bacteroidota bacterium]
MMVKDTIFQKKKNLNCKGKLLDFSTPRIMGILNLTPDSFYDGGKNKSVSDAEKKISLMFAEGADIIDIGAVSTRPGAKPADKKTELSRLIQVMELILKKFPDKIFSIDTFRADVAKLAVEKYGISIINDISAGNMDNKMHETVASLKVPYIIMHMQGTPENMQVNPEYKNVTNDTILFFANKIKELKNYGINDIIIDPGFGFGKTDEHNYRLMSELDNFKLFENLIMVGISRKSMINRILKCDPLDSLNGTTVLNTVALLKGADILRVHDVKEAKECIAVYNKLSSFN